MASEFDEQRDDCNHTNYIVEGEYRICTECGECLPFLPVGKEFSDKVYRDQSCCYRSKNSDRSLYKDLEGLNIPSAIAHEANEKYSKLIEYKVYRGDRRKSIIAACLYYAYIELQETQTIDNISEQFGLRKRHISQGLRDYQSIFTKANDITLHPGDFVKSTILAADLDINYCTNIERFWSRIRQFKTNELNRAKPQSIAAALVYYYIIKTTNPSYSKSEYASHLKLSVPTITKLVKELERIVSTYTVEL